MNQHQTHTETKYSLHIEVDGRKIYFGEFDTEADAKEAGELLRDEWIHRYVKDAPLVHIVETMKFVTHSAGLN